MAQTRENQFDQGQMKPGIPNGIPGAHTRYTQAGTISAQPQVNGYPDEKSRQFMQPSTMHSQTIGNVPAPVGNATHMPALSHPQTHQPVSSVPPLQWQSRSGPYKQISSDILQRPQHQTNSTSPMVAPSNHNPPTAYPFQSSLSQAQPPALPVMSQFVATRSASTTTEPPPAQPAAMPPPAATGYPPVLQNGPSTGPPPASTYDGVHPSRRRQYPKQPLPVSPPNRPPNSQQPALIQQPGSFTEQPSTTNQQLPKPSAISTVNQTQQPPTSYTQDVQQPSIDQAGKMMGQMTVQQSPQGVDLMREKQSFPKDPLSRPTPPVSPEMQKKEPDPGVIHCTFNAIPSTSSLQKKCKLPFGIHTHPFKEMQNMPIISNSVITRCRSCRTYLNPFVSILDHRRWQCNMCYRVNDIPEELCYDQASRQYQDVRKRPELTSSSVEFIAPSEYMLRPPQPSIFLFVLDVTYSAVASGYVQIVCDLLRDTIDKLPGDSRCMMGFLTFNKSVHFYNLKESQPQMMVMSDIDDVYLPVPDGLLVNVKEYRENILDLLEALPLNIKNEIETLSATGAALQAARKMVSSTGGRITLFQTCLPSTGPGKLVRRESDSTDVTNLNASTDFYKKMALECAGEQIAVDIFLLSGQYTDIASLSCVSRYCSGCIHYYPEFHASKNLSLTDKFFSDLKRYLTRPIGFEAVMRMRCTKGLSIHTFHGNFFVRSTDLLSLPNVNPDQSFSMQIEIEDSLTDISQVCFQAALLYTNIKGERRIRIHTLALPVTSKLSDVYQYADQQAIISSLSKMAVDRTLMSSLGDAREALMNACIDFLKVYRSDVCDQKKSTAVLCPRNLSLLPLLILALMKNDAFKLGSGVNLDRRVYSLLEFKWIPFLEGILKIYPRLYSVLDLAEKPDGTDDEKKLGIMQASAELLSRQGVYIMDAGKVMYLFVGRAAPDDIIHKLFNVSNFQCLPEELSRIPELNNPLNVAARKFIKELQDVKQLESEFQIIREDSRHRTLFINNLIDDRTESSMSYQEFLQHIQKQLNG